MNASNMCSVCCSDMFFASIGSIYSCWDNFGTLCLIDKAENVSAVTSKFLEIVNFTKLILLSVDVTLLLISSEIIEICQILSEEFEKTLVLGAASRPLRHRDKAARQGGGRQEKQLPVCQPGIQN